MLCENFGNQPCFFIRLNEMLAAPSISRHGKVQASLPLLIWLNEIVR